MMFDAMKNMANMPTQEEMLNVITNMIEQTDDPLKKMLGQMAIEKMQNQPTESQSINRKMKQEYLPKQVVQMREDIAKLIEMNRATLIQLKELQEVHQNLQQLNFSVASSVGACSCWGQNLACPTCKGKGLPGTLEIDEHNFEILIQPFFEELLKNQPKKPNNN